MSIEFIKPDVMRQWSPNSIPQTKFIALPNIYREALYGGANGGGKTDALIWYPIARGWFEHPQFHAVYFRGSYPQIEKSLLPRALEVWKDIFGAQFSDKPPKFVFPSGATIHLSYLESMKHAQDHKSAEYNLIVFEELTEFLEDVYMFLLQRLRSHYDGGPAVCRSAATPGDIGHVWVRKRFIDPFREGMRPIHQTLDNGNVVKRIFIPARLFDNPDVMRRNPEYVNMLLMQPEAEKRAKLYGDWYAQVGQVFTEFREKNYPDEPQCAIHVIPGFKIPFYWPKVVAIDWGYRAKTAVIWAAISPDGRVYIYRCYECVKTSIEEWSMNIRRLSEFDENIVAYVIDPSSARNLGQKTIKQQVIDATGWRLEDADNDRLGGISLIHEYLRWKQKPPDFTPKENFDTELSMRILRVMGENKYREYLEQFEPAKPENNIPKLQMFDIAQNKSLIDTMSQCVHDDKRVEDVKEFFGDDFFDCLRYNLKAVSRFWALSKKAGGKYEKLASIVQNFEQTQDYNTYYQQMAGFDKEHRNPKSDVGRIYHSSKTLRGLRASKDAWDKLLRPINSRASR